ncbi:unannotated protein [freshwater metagenome]|uniref:Unannotated protein n=1 Tax=freshwater metagenome TaxID=449393 RepID=A0A6J7IWS6_9ZZZZ
MDARRVALIAVAIGSIGRSQEAGTGTEFPWLGGRAVLIGDERIGPTARDGFVADGEHSGIAPYGPRGPWGARPDLMERGEHL